MWAPNGVSAPPSTELNMSTAAGSRKRQALRSTTSLSTWVGICRTPVPSGVGHLVAYVADQTKWAEAWFTLKENRCQQRSLHHCALPSPCLPGRPRMPCDPGQRRRLPVRVDITDVTDRRIATSGERVTFIALICWWPATSSSAHQRWVSRTGGRPLHTRLERQQDRGRWDFGRIAPPGDLETTRSPQRPAPSLAAGPTPATPVPQGVRRRCALRNAGPKRW